MRLKVASALKRESTAKLGEYCMFATTEGAAEESVGLLRFIAKDKQAGA